MLDIIYVKYLHYRNNRKNRLVPLQKNIIGSIDTYIKQNEISRLATMALENPVDVGCDLAELQIIINQKFFKHVFTEALIFSQLFKVPLNPAGKPFLYSLDEFSKLPKHNNSFVRFHDEGCLIGR